METIRFVRERIKEHPSVRFSAGDMKAVLDEVFGTEPPGIVMKFSEVERRIRIRELTDPVEIMKALQKVMCEAAGIETTYIERIPEEGKKAETDGLKKELAFFAAESGCTCAPLSQEEDEGPCLRCRALAWLVGR